MVKDFLTGVNRLGHSLTTNIGYPKLFTGGQARARFRGPPPAVNNFVDGRAPRTDSHCRAMSFCVYIAPVSRPGGPGLLTTSRINDYELIDRPAGRGLALQRLLKRASLELEDDSPILTSPGQARGRPVNRSNQTHP